MKFSNGCWLQKEGVECFSPAQVYFTTITESLVKICAPCNQINHRCNTLGGVNITLEITSCMENIIRVRAYHYAGVKEDTTKFELNAGNRSYLKAREDANEVRILSGTLMLVITKQNWGMAYYRLEKAYDETSNRVLLSKSGLKDLACMKTSWKGLAYTHNEEGTYFRQQLSLGVGEYVYGLGERFTPFIKNGQSIDIWNEDGGTSTDQSYKNIPFYITNKGYGVFINQPEKVMLEVASEMVTKVGFTVEGESIDYFFINGPSMKEVLMKYTDLTGKPSLPAPWTFGLWLSTSFTTDYDEETVTEFVDGMFARDIPLQVFHFDCFWMKEFSWCDFTWDSRVFPDPAGMLRRLKEKGLKICVWINSYIGQESILFEEGKRNGYFLKRDNGNVYQWDMWQSGMAIVDFTNPEACQWYTSKLEYLLELGVDCFKTDFGERIPTDVVYYNGANPKKMHNLYTYLYNKTVYDLLERKRGKGEAILFARSATVGGQKFPVHWGGDCWSDYESMEESMRGGLSLMMSGFGFWSHDIGGFESTSTADVYKRWVAFGLLSTHSRLHGSTSYRVPWFYDEEAVQVVSFFTKLKSSLMPYLYLSAIETSNSGIPMMRSMILEFMSDPTCAYLDKQYMLGDSVLVAPILNDEGIGRFYLPKGRWTQYLTNEEKCGEHWYEEAYDYFSLPMLIRENTIIAVKSDASQVVYNYADGVTLKVYALIDGVATSTAVYDDKSQLVLKATAIKENGCITVEVKTSLPYQIELINEIGKEIITSGTVNMKDNVTHIAVKKGERTVIHY